MPPSDAAVALYHQRLENLRGRTSSALVTMWDDLDNYTDADLEAFTARAAPLLAGAKAATVATAAAFFALAMSTRPAPVAAKDVPVEPRITHPFLATWHALKEGRPLPDAIAAGRSQAEAVGFDFVQSTSRQTGDYVAKSSGQSVKWRRIPNPGACSWCSNVARRTYRTSAAANFGHDRCFCITAPAT